MQTPAEPDLKYTVWRDDTFFAQFPLNVHTVIDYFSRSPFYDHRCNNEECKRQGMPPDNLRCALRGVYSRSGICVFNSKNLIQVLLAFLRIPSSCTVIRLKLICRHMYPGLEYVLTFAAEPTLYVIKCQHRTSPESATQRAFYYVLHGSIYEAPSVLSCLQVRAERCRYYVQQAFEQLKTDLEPLGWRERHRENKVKKAKKQRGATQPEAEQEDVTMVGDEDIAQKSVGADMQLENEVDRQGAVWMAQPPPAPRAFPQWVVHTDSVIMNVLARYVTSSVA